MKQSKRQLIDNSLFLYGGLVSFALTGYAFLNLKNTTSLYTLILFLPVSLYFLAKIILMIGKSIHKAINRNQEDSPYFGNFTLSAFLGQTEASFLINLILLSLAIAIILFKISLNIIR